MPRQLIKSESTREKRDSKSRDPRDIARYVKFLYVQRMFYCLDTLRQRRYPCFSVRRGCSKIVFSTFSTRTFRTIKFMARHGAN